MYLKQKRFTSYQSHHSHIVTTCLVRTIINVVLRLPQQIILCFLKYFCKGWVGFVALFHLMNQTRNAGCNDIEQMWQLFRISTDREPISTGNATDSVVTSSDGL